MIDRRAMIQGGAASGALAASLVSGAGGALGQTTSALAPPFDKPFVDVDEWRDTPVRHRYVHGGFTGTDLLFSCYFPPKEQYEGRFFQPLAATSGSENTASMAMFQAGSAAFAIDSGGYLVESNQGARHMFGGSSAANAAAAIYSRQLAAEMYGPHRPYGYVYGGSGGAFKTLSCVETQAGVWDGSVPFVHGSPVAIPYVFTVQAHAMRILGPKFPQIVDALEPGGSGDMYAGLTEEEREALAEVTAMGFPPRAWFNYEKIAFGYTGVFSSLVDMIVQGDPTYFEDFWTKPGYLGANPTPSLLAARVSYPTQISALIMPDEARAMGLPLTMSAAQSQSGVAFPAALRLERQLDRDLRGASLIVKSGGAKGAVLYVAGQTPDAVMIGFGAQSFMALPALRAGDEVEVDNSVYLASQTYHRHQVQAPEFYVWDYFRKPNGQPIYPQRPQPLMAGVARPGDSATQSGQFDGKMIVMQALMDEAAYPWQADWYRKRVETAQGAAFEDKYRLYFVDHAVHTTQTVLPTDERPVATTRTISYQGVLQQSLRELADWVEKGVAPPPSSAYRIEDGQVLLPERAGDRLGLQPVAQLSANGGTIAHVKLGQPVTFDAVIETPPGAGVVVGAEWDFEGDGAFKVTSQVTQPARHLTFQQTYTFSRPGIYFPALRASSERGGDTETPFARPQNLARVRVVVT